MNKVTIKVFFSTMLIISLSSLIPHILSWVGYGDYRPDFENDRPYFFLMIIGVTAMILIFNFIMNRIIYKRMALLNNATTEVIQGNYDIEIEEGAKDEISALIRNFNTMIKELKSNEYQNKEFVRNFSHELKTPLSAIKGYSDLIINADISKDEQLEYASIISNEANRLTELSKNMLLISLVDTNVIVPKLDEFNVSEQIRNVIQLTQLSWEEREIEFDIVLPDKIIISNKELLYQVWVNLLGNAIKFSPLKSEIKINLEIKEEELVFSISNKGTIEQEDLDKVFNLFFVIEKSRADNSSGVGLALTKKIVNKLNGSIKAESHNNVVTFVVNIPISE
jgi:signal transduction histidine kinase